MVGGRYLLSFRAQKSCLIYVETISMRLAFGLLVFCCIAVCNAIGAALVYITFIQLNMNAWTVISTYYLFQR